MFLQIGLPPKFALFKSLRSGKDMHVRHVNATKTAINLKNMGNNYFINVFKLIIDEIKSEKII